MLLPIHYILTLLFVAIGKLRREAERAKKQLSLQHQATIEIESFFEGEDLVETLTRAKFEELNNDLFKKTLKPVQQVLDDAGNITVYFLLVWNLLTCTLSRT